MPRLITALALALLAAPWLQPAALPPLPQTAVAHAAVRETGRQYLLNRAAAGEAAAQFRLGQWYAAREDASVADRAAARGWYEKAAEQRDPRAQTALALLDLNDAGQRRARGETAAAAALRGQAIDQLNRATTWHQYAPAYFWRGVIEAEDNFGEWESMRAGYHWRLAVAQHHPDAMIGQGLIYLLPKATVVDNIAIHATANPRWRTPQYHWVQAVTYTNGTNPLAPFLLQLAAKPDDKLDYPLAHGLFHDYYNAYDSGKTAQWLRDLDHWPLPRDRANRHCPPASMQHTAQDLDPPDRTALAARAAATLAAMHYWQPRAEAGDAAAQYRLGQMYARGEGYRQNLAVARQWYEQAAAQDYAPAHTARGILALLAPDQPGDNAAALAAFLLAADHNEANAHYWLAQLARKNIGPYRSGIWQNAALAQNHPAALRAAGEYTRDPGERRQWLEKAAACGDASAMRLLGIAALRPRLGRPCPRNPPRLPPPTPKPTLGGLLRAESRKPGLPLHPRRT